jgi:hypothetical protein
LELTSSAMGCTDVKKPRNLRVKGTAKKSKNEQKSTFSDLHEKKSNVRIFDAYINV